MNKNKYYEELVIKRVNLVLTLMSYSPIDLVNWYKTPLNQPTITILKTPKHFKISQSLFGLLNKSLLNPHST